MHVVTVVAIESTFGPSFDPPQLQPVSQESIRKPKGSPNFYRAHSLYGVEKN
jgi:hypothetical protein